MAFDPGEQHWPLVARWTQSTGVEAIHWYLGSLQADGRFWGYAHFRSPSRQANRSFAGTLDGQTLTRVATIVDRLISDPPCMRSSFSEGQIGIGTRSSYHRVFELMSESDDAQNPQLLETYYSFVALLQPILAEVIDWSDGDPNMDRMTDRSRKVMSIAEQQARRLKAVTVEPEHVLLGLALEGAGVAACIIRHLSVGPEQIEAAIGIQADSALHSNGNTPLPLATGSCDLINRALEEAVLLNHNYIGTEHLILAITTVSEGSVPEILARLRLSPEEVRREVYDLLGHAFPVGS